MEDLEIYEAERIVGKRKRKGRVQYLIKWSGYPDSCNSWEPFKNVLDRELIRSFLNRNKTNLESISKESTVNDVAAGTKNCSSQFYNSTSECESEGNGSGEAVNDDVAAQSEGNGNGEAVNYDVAAQSEGNGSGEAVNDDVAAQSEGNGNGEAVNYDVAAQSEGNGSGEAVNDDVAAQSEGNGSGEAVNYDVAAQSEGNGNGEAVNYDVAAQSEGNGNGEAVNYDVAAQSEGNGSGEAVNDVAAQSEGNGNGEAVNYDVAAQSEGNGSGEAVNDDVAAQSEGNGSGEAVNYDVAAQSEGNGNGEAVNYDVAAQSEGNGSGEAVNYDVAAQSEGNGSGEAVNDDGAAQSEGNGNGEAVNYDVAAQSEGNGSGEAVNYDVAAQSEGNGSGEAVNDVAAQSEGNGSGEAVNDVAVGTKNSNSQSNNAIFEYNGEQYYMPKKILKMADGSIAVTVSDVKDIVAKMEEISDEAIPVTSKFKRRQNRCPECRLMKVDLPNHMKRKHGWEKEKASKVLQITNQRKIKGQKKRNVARVNCNLCEAKIFNLRSHTKRCHPSYSNTEAVTPGSFYGSSSEEPGNPVKVEESSSSELPVRDTVEGILNEFMVEAHVEPLEALNDDYVLPACLDRMINHFELWQQGPQGGGNKKVTAVHNSHMMKRICRQLNAKALSCLLCDGTMWRMFYVKKNDKSWSGHTSRTYMVALKKFMSFICKDVRENRYSNSEERNYAQSMYTDFANWSKSFKNQIGVETAKKRIRQTEVLLTAEKMKKYRASYEYRRAFTLLSECRSPDFILNQRSFIIIRNYLLFTLNWRNANRAGVLAEFTVNDYEAKKKYHCRETGSTEHMMSILNHKTLGTHGPAKIAFTGQMVLHMDTYRDFIRTKLLIESDVQFFFTTFTGNSLVDCVSHPISAHARASGLGHMTSNDFRRSATTITKEVDPSMSRNVAKHMNHSEVTANRVYDLASKDKACFASARFLEECYGGNLLPTSSIVEVPPTEEVCKKESAERVPRMKKREEEETDSNYTEYVGLEPSRKKPFLSERPTIHLDDSSVISCSSESVIASSLPLPEIEGIISEDRRQDLLRSRRSEHSAKAANATYTLEDRATLKTLFDEMLEQKSHYTGATVDVIVQSAYPQLFEKYGSYSIRNKFRDAKARFLRRPK